MIRVVIADDHALIRDGLRRLMDDETSLSLVGEAENSAALFDLMEHQAFDVLLLDISMPDRDGLDILKDVKVRKPDIKVLMLSMHPEERYAQRALKSGASGYISKGCSSHELVSAICTVAWGKRYLSEEYMREYFLGGREETADAPHTRLSDREFQVLLLIGRGLSTGQIAESLNMSTNTVYTHRRRIMEKMCASTNAELVHYVIEHRLID